jgi:hypothetical protein
VQRVDPHDIDLKVPLSSATLGKWSEPRGAKRSSTGWSASPRSSTSRCVGAGVRSARGAEERAGVRETDRLRAMSKHAHKDMFK